MNIKNKIVVRRGVSFEDPRSSALSLNAYTKETIYAEELAFLTTGAATDTVLKAEKFIKEYANEGAADTALKESGITRNLYICYQGAEEPYNMPDVTAPGVTDPSA